MRSLLSLLETSRILDCQLQLETWFDVYEELDKTEGKGGRKLKFRTQDKKDALELSKNLGVFGGNGTITEKTFYKISIPAHNCEYLIPFVNSEYETTEVIDKTRLVLSAMKKLSKEEIRALNL